MSLDVVLPAGGRISGEFADETGISVKALIEIEGRTVLDRTLDAVRATGLVNRAVVIGPQEIAVHPCANSADAVLPEGGDSGPANILRGIEYLRETDGSHADRVLILTTDLPFLTPGSIREFVDNCPTDAAFCAPLVSREAFEERFEGSGNTYVKLADGQWTMGGAFLVDPESIEANRNRIEAAFQARKSQIAMARLLGLGFIVKFLTGRLSIPDIESRCSKMLGCSCVAVPDSPAELAFDLDELTEYRYAAKHASVGAANA
jgi:GTP:adenosylcobinamide-phosphate guanylyltransferase